MDSFLVLLGIVGLGARQRLGLDGLVLSFLGLGFVGLGALWLGLWFVVFSFCLLFGTLCILRMYLVCLSLCF